MGGRKNMKHHFRQIILAALFAVLSLGSVPAFSQDQGFYAGLNFGQSKLKDACSGGTICDDKDTALSIFAGYQLNRNFGFEFAYTDLGKATESGLFGGVPVTASLEATGFEFSAVGTIPINQQFSLYGKLGFFMWDADLKGTVGGIPVSVSDDGTDLTIAIGARFSFTKNFAMQVQWQRYELDDFDVDVIGVGILFRF
jgi:OOP family OmpA-OmpF porin